MKPSATSGAADVTQAIPPQCHSAHAHSQDGNPALRCGLMLPAPHSQALRLEDSNHPPFIRFPSFPIPLLSWCIELARGASLWTCLPPIRHSW